MSENHLHESEAKAVADIVRKHIAPALIDVADALNVGALGPDGSDEVPVLVLPTGLQAHSIKPFLDQYRTAPERREGTAKLVELESFCDHVNRFKDADSAIFAEPSTTSPKLMAVLDYHQRCNLPTGEDVVVGEVVRGEVKPVDGKPRFGKHRAVYPFPLSDEWQAWLAKNGHPMPQAEFATWLEDRIVDVADPQAAFTSAKRFAEALGITTFASPNKLLDLSRGLTIHVDERAATKVNPSTGETSVFYSAEHQDEAGAPLVIPRAFLIQIPVFRAGTLYQLPVRLKYRLASGRLAWFYDIHNVLKAFDDAFREACDLAAEKTGLPLFYGSPEV